MDKLLEAQRQYREYRRDPKLQMRVLYDPSQGYRMVVDGTIFCPYIRSFEAFVDRVLEITRALAEHAGENARIEGINQILERDGGESPER